MQNTDIFGVIVWAIFVGGFTFVVLSHSLQQSRRTSVIRWCLLVGALSIGYLSFLVILNEKPSPKFIISLFVSLPAFICGLLLSLQNVISKAKNDKIKPTNPSSGTPNGAP